MKYVGLDNEGLKALVFAQLRAAAHRTKAPRRPKVCIPKPPDAATTARLEKKHEAVRAAMNPFIPRDAAKAPETAKVNPFTPKDTEYTGSANPFTA